MLGSVAGMEILKVIDHRDALGLRGTKEIILDRVGTARVSTFALFLTNRGGTDCLLVAKRDLDRAFEAMGVPIVRGTLISLVLLHQGQQFLGRPSIGLEVVIVGGRCTSVHLNGVSNTLESIIDQWISYHKVDGRSSTENVGSWHNGASAAEPF